MSKFIVHFNPALPPERVRNLCTALEQLKDVEIVEMLSNSSPSNHDAEKNQNYVPPQQPYPSYEQQRPTHIPPQPPPYQQQGGQQNYAPPQQPPENYAQTQQAGFAGQAPPYRKTVNNPEEIGVNTQRHAINHAIKWGIRRQLISVEELSGMSPEETVKRAMGLIDMMSDEDKKQMGSDLSKNYQ